MQTFKHPNIQTWNNKNLRICSATGIRYIHICTLTNSTWTYTVDDIDITDKYLKYTNVHVWMINVRFYIYIRHLAEIYL